MEEAQASGPTQKATRTNRQRRIEVVFSRFGRGGRGLDAQNTIGTQLSSATSGELIPHNARRVEGGTDLQPDHRHRPRGAPRGAGRPRPPPPRPPPAPASP